MLDKRKHPTNKQTTLRQRDSIATYQSKDGQKDGALVALQISQIHPRHCLFVEEKVKEGCNEQEIEQMFAQTKKKKETKNSVRKRKMGVIQKIKREKETRKLGSGERGETKEERELTAFFVDQLKKGKKMTQTKMAT